MGDREVMQLGEMRWEPLEHKLNPELFFPFQKSQVCLLEFQKHGIFTLSHLKALHRLSVLMDSLTGIELFRMCAFMIILHHLMHSSHQLLIGLS